jgi:hypothetical protein
MTLRQTVAESILGTVQWEDADLGYCKCPGDSQHNSPTGPRHCRVTLDKVPTIYCFHSSCETDLATANKLLRSVTGREELKASGNLKPKPPTPEEIAECRK